MRGPCLVSAALALLGCAPEVGVCDTERALELAYGDSLPATTGQALMTQNCANGYCHMGGAPAAYRVGAPAGLDFDVSLASSDAARFVPRDVEDAAVARLEADRGRALDMRERVLGQVRAGHMPPWDASHPPAAPTGRAPASFVRRAYEASVAAAYMWVAPSGEFEPLPGLDSEDGAEMFRNWLACRTPVVERVGERADGEPTRNFIAERCETTCVGPTWPAISAGILERRCATAGCHDASDEPQGGLALTAASGLDALYASLFEGDAGQPRLPAGESCAADAAGAPQPHQGTALLTPGDAAASLLFLKVEPPDEGVCGSAMPETGAPLSEQRRCVLEAWIECGACPEADGGACRDCLSDPALLARCNLADFADAPDAFACAVVPSCLARLSL